MARQRGTQDAWTGRSGQLAVLAELIFRQCNAAIPEVDVGTDVFAFHDESEEVGRLQVKTGQAKRYKKEQGYSVQFAIPLRQLEKRDWPRLHYVLAVRLEGQWVDFLLIGRPELRAYRNGPSRFGTENVTTRELVLSIQFRPTGVVCGEVDLTPHRNAWAHLPPLHVATGEGVPPDQDATRTEEPPPFST